jgi:O-antigen/teichoic acid export membrane protein
MPEILLSREHLLAKVENLPLARRITFEIGQQRNKVFAVADQALFAGGNLFLTVGLGRVLPAKEYGLFALAQSAYFVLASCHSALVIEPLLVYRQHSYPTRSNEYYGATVAMSVAFSSACALIVLIIACFAHVLGQHDALTCAVGVAILTPPTSLLWLLRRTSFAELRPHLAAKAGLLYLGTAIIVLTALKLTANIGVITGFSACSVAALPSIALLLRTLSVQRPVGGLVFAREVLAKHWVFARWSLQTGLLRWIPSNAPQWFAASYLGPAAAANLKVLLTPLMPFMQSVGALSALLVPSFVLAAPGEERRRKVWNNLKIGTLAGISYLVPASIFHRQLIGLLFGRTYIGISWLLPIMLCAAISEVWITVLSPYFLASLLPQRLFVAYSLSALACLAFGYSAVHTWATAGAVFLYVGSGFATAGMLSLFFWVERERSKSEFATGSLGGAASGK